MVLAQKTGSDDKISVSIFRLAAFSLLARGPRHGNWCPHFDTGGEDLRSAELEVNTHVKPVPLERPKFATRPATADIRTVLWLP